MSCSPKFVRNAHRLDAELGPPSDFIAGSMQIAMMRATERHRELVAHFEAEASWLREAQVMGVRGLAAADHACLLGHELAVMPVTPPPQFRRHGVVFEFKR